MRLMLPLACLLVAAAPRLAVPPVLAGEWVNSDHNANTVTRLIISGNGDIHAYAKCNPSDCDWRTVPLHAIGNDRYKAEFKAPYETNNLELLWVRDSHHPDGLLHVRDWTIHAAQNGHPGWKKESPELIFDKEARKIVRP